MRRSLLVLLTAAAALSACGQSGDLYLPVDPPPAPAPPPEAPATPPAADEPKKDEAR